MNIGITQIILGKMSLEETLDLCHEAGYESIELVFSEDKDLNVEMNAAELAQVKSRCQEAKVEIASVIAWYNERGNLLSRDRGQRELCCKSLARSLEIAGALGVDAVLLHPGQRSAEGTYQQAFNDLCSALKEMAELAAQNKTAIGVENVWNKFMLSPMEARSLVEAVDSDWVGIYLDTANMMAYGHPEHWIRALGSAIKKVHFKDFNRREHRFVHLMDGDTDWPTIMAELRTIGYNSSLIHEVGGDHQVLVEMAERMRRIVAL